MADTEGVEDLSGGSHCMGKKWRTEIRPEAVAGTQANALIATLQSMRLNLALPQPTKCAR